MGSSSPSGGETKKYLKPPPRWRCISSEKMVLFQLVMFVFGGTKQTLLLRKYGTCKACFASSSYLWSQNYISSEGNKYVFFKTLITVAVPKNVWKNPINTYPAPQKNPKKKCPPEQRADPIRILRQGGERGHQPAITQVAFGEGTRGHGWHKPQINLEPQTTGFFLNGCLVKQTRFEVDVF